jgi:hypothetical protein
MRVVLFGAGASFGSGSVVPTPPPLGAGLFPVLHRLYASWRSIPDDAAKLFVPNFEAGMAAVTEKYSMAIAPLMQDMAIFFAAFGMRPEDDNLYLRLLRDTAARKDLIWSTLNYECLLEIAGSILTHPINYFAEPTDSSKELPVWKLHGSCNFKVTGLEATRGVSFGGGVVFGGGIHPMNPGEVRAHYKGTTALYPAMALYAKGKPIAMSPAPIQDAQKRWAERVRSADKVLLIGVRPNADDAHLWDPLKETDAAIAYVGGKSELDAWIAAHRSTKPTEYLGNRWTSTYDAAIDFLIN